MKGWIGDVHLYSDDVKLEVCALEEGRPYKIHRAVVSLPLLTHTVENLEMERTDLTMPTCPPLQSISVSTPHWNPGGPNPKPGDTVKFRFLTHTGIWVNGIIKDGLIKECRRKLKDCWIRIETVKGKTIPSIKKPRIPAIPTDFYQICTLPNLKAIKVIAHCKQGDEEFYAEHIYPVGK